MNIENRIIEELRKSAKIGETQGETLRLDRAEQIIRRYLKGESFGECSRRKWYQKGLEDGRTHFDNDGWIPLEDRLPEDGESILCCSDDERMMIGVLHKEYYIDFGIAVAENYNQIMHGVIAWQPLPEPYYRKSGKESECGVRKIKDPDR